MGNAIIQKIVKSTRLEDSIYIEAIIKIEDEDDVANLFKSKKEQNSLNSFRKSIKLKSHVKLSNKIEPGFYFKLPILETENFTRGSDFHWTLNLPFIDLKNKIINNQTLELYLKDIKGIGDKGVLLLKKILEQLSNKKFFKIENSISWLEEILEEDNHPYSIELSSKLTKSLFNKLQSGIRNKIKNHEKRISMSSMTNIENNLFLQHGISIPFIKNLKENTYEFLELGNEPFDFLKYLRLHPYTLLRYNNELIKLNFYNFIMFTRKLLKDVTINKKDFNNHFILLNSFIIHLLSKEESKGNTYITLDTLIDKIDKYNNSLDFEEKFGLEGDFPLVIHLDSENPIKTLQKAIKPEKESLLSFSLKDGSLFNEPNETFICLDHNYTEELAINNALKELKRRDSLFHKIPTEELTNGILDLEKKKGFQLEENQNLAVLNSCHSNFSLIVGGPGTGKTTIVQFIIELAEMYNIKTLLCAPTGTAAKRMSEVTGRQAYTIHRALKYKPFGGFEINARNPIPEGTLVIVDESSMLNQHLGKTLLEACRKSQIILVGDIDQLPPVGSGEVLKNILVSKRFKTSLLTKIFRQALDNPIVDFSYKIKNNVNIEEFNKFIYRRGPIKDFKKALIYCSESNQTDSEQEENILNKTYDIIKELKDINYQILVSTNKSNLALNKYAQKIYNPDSNTIYINKLKQQLKIKDRIMQIKNNYEYSIFNGSIGYIINRFENWESLLAFSEDEEKGNSELQDFIAYVYSKPKLIRKYKQDFCLLYFLNIGYKAIKISEIEDNITLSYSMTIHKSQGQEFERVIMAINSTVMSSREIVYTGATRAKNNLITITTKNFLEKSKNRGQDLDLKRYTLLEKMILFT